MKNTIEKAVDDWAIEKNAQQVSLILMDTLTKKLNAIAIPKEVFEEEIDDILRHGLISRQTTMWIKELKQKLLNTEEEKEEGLPDLPASRNPFGGIDESHSAYCAKHGRSLHKIIKVKNGEEEKA